MSNAPAAPAPPKFTKKDFQTDQEVRWCPGCGDYAILNALQQVLAAQGLERNRICIVSGIGCSSRLPYYVNTYGIHGIHGRAPAIATGLRLANPSEQAWIATGDGDALSIGGNHILHICRRNVDVKIILFNNRIYGLTKGQYSPTSELGKINKTAPLGTVERPINPTSLALAAGATFVARSVDIYSKHLQEVFRRAALHRGTAFIEVFQNCNVFNDEAFVDFTDPAVREEKNLFLEHGKPMRFGKQREWGLRLSGLRLEKVKVGEGGVGEQDVLVHDEASTNPGPAFLLSQMEYPVPLGVFRAVSEPTFEDRVYAQMEEARKKQGPGDLQKLVYSGDLWDVS